MTILQIPLAGLTENVLPRIAIDLIASLLLARVLYFPLHRRRDYLFSFILFNALIFALCLVLRTASIQVGLAFGLFAVFSIFRYRTVTIPVREMGYFFATIALAMINALVTVENWAIILTGTNLAILLILFVLEYAGKRRREHSIEITSERIDLIGPDRREELIADLRQRTGLPIDRFELGPLNLQRDFVVITAYYLS